MIRNGAFSLYFFQKIPEIVPDVLFEFSVIFMLLTESKDIVKDFVFELLFVCH